MSDISPRIRRIFLACGIGLLIGIIVACLAEERTASAILRGDFPAFYTLAYTVLKGDPGLLYDERHQHQLQNELWPTLGGSFLPAAYPPYLAKIIAPLAYLSPSVARVVWVGTMVVIAVLALTMLTRISPRLRGCRREVVVGGFLFAPFLLGVLGGQLVAVSLLVYVTLLLLSQKQRTFVNDVSMGAVAGWWLVKPHFSLFALAILLVQGRWWALLGWGSVAALLWGIGATVLGFSWLSIWLTFADHFTRMNLVSNAFQMTGIAAQIYLIASRLGGDWIGQSFAWTALSVFLGLVAVGGLWVSEQYARRFLTRDASFSFLMLPPVIALCAPLVNFYDLSLFLVPLFCVARPTEPRHLLVGGMIVIASLGCLVLSAQGLPGAYFVLSVLLTMILIRSACRDAAQPER